MRVGFVIPELTRPSGWRTYSVGTVRAIAEHTDHEPVLVVSAEDEDAADEALPGFERHVLPRTQSSPDEGFSPLVNLGAWMKARWSGRLGLDMVHSLEGYPTGLLGAWLARGNGAGHVVMGVGTYSVRWHDSPLHGWAYRRVLRAADAICCISDETARRIGRRFDDPERPALALHTVLLGTDFADDVEPPPSGEKTGPPLILSVGAVKPRKGYHTSIAAFARVRRQVPDARYCIVGVMDRGDDYVDRLRDLIEREGIGGVELLGEVGQQELAELYRSASIFLLASEESAGQFEGFGLVFIEAGAYGLPVVATRSGGIPSAVKDGETGLLTGEGDSAALADAVLRLLRDPALARSLGARNRAWSEHLSWKRFAEEQDAIYRRIAEARTRNGGR